MSILQSHFEKEYGLKFVRYGWFNKSTKYELGYLKRPEDEKLLHIIDNFSVVRCFGHHECELCDHLTDKEKKVHNFTKYGNGEIWIKSSNNKVWKVPVMIHHYINMHCIKPNQEFVNDLKKLKDDVMRFFYDYEQSLYEKIKNS